MYRKKKNCRKILKTYLEYVNHINCISVKSLIQPHQTQKLQSKAQDGKSLNEMSVFGQCQWHWVDKFIQSFLPAPSAFYF